MHLTATLVFAAMATTATAVDFTCTPNSDFWGDDLTHQERSETDCKSACLANPACNALTWVPTQNNVGQCYLKHLQDPSRCPTSNAGTDKPAMTSCKLPPQSWVVYKGINLYGDTLASPANVATIDDCVRLCQQNPQCNSASYTGYYPTCELKTAAKTFQYAISKAVDLKAFSAMVHNYKFCRAEADLFGKGDVFDFKGSFQDCAKCIDSAKGTNAFTWTAGPTGYYTVPLEEFGHCYCKKVDSFDPAALGYVQGVFCHD